jgi:hypothetical protein
LVQFYYEEIASDLEDLAQLAGDFLREGTAGRMLASAEDLRARRKAPSTIWSVDEAVCFSIGPSIGECELGKKTRWNLLGQLTFRWEITRTKPAKPKKAIFSVADASTRVKIFRCTKNGEILSQTPLAEWRFEIGGPNHPGCLMHTQMEWQTNDNDRGGKLEIPRLPTIILVPSECMDFLLGELFQERWPKVVDGSGDDFKRWKGNHRGRLVKLLRAQTELLGDPVGSPWQAVKQWKASELILRGSN